MKMDRKLSLYVEKEAEPIHGKIQTETERSHGGCINPPKNSLSPLLLNIGSLLFTAQTINISHVTLHNFSKLTF